jgi:hypothetical protein
MAYLVPRNGCQGVARPARSSDRLGVPSAFIAKESGAAKLFRFKKEGRGKNGDKTMRAGSQGTTAGSWSIARKEIRDALAVRQRNSF